MIPIYVDNTTAKLNGSGSEVVVVSKFYNQLT